jgi:hypothetical protein
VTVSAAGAGADVTADDRPGESRLVVTIEAEKVCAVDMS